MNDILIALINAISPSALPIVICIIACAYLYLKLNGIKKDRTETKTLRDADSQSMHDTLLKHTFEISNLKDTTSLHAIKLEDLTQQLQTLNINIVDLTATMKEFKQHMEHINGR